MKVLPSQIQGALLTLPRWAKRSIVIAADAVICLMTTWLAFYLRLGEWRAFADGPLFATLVSIAIALPLFQRFGFYRAIFRYVGLSGLPATTQALLIYGFVYSLIFTWYGIPGTPRTVGLIQPILLFVFLLAARSLSYFALSGDLSLLTRRAMRQRVLIYGAGSAGRHLATAIRHDRGLALVGFLDDDARMVGHTIAGTPVFGTARIEQTAHGLGATEVLLAVPSATRARRAEIIENLRGTDLKVRTLPALTDVTRGNVSIEDLRELDIEDLLGRASVAPDVGLLRRNVSGKTVLVTGAGGSIGSELCRQIASLAPEKLLLLDLSEYQLYAISEELRNRFGDVPIVALLGSVCDDHRVRSILAAWKPHTIFHAAAYKHVPLVEHNVIDGVRNNVIGTLTMAQAARAAGTRNFILISTDKAVRPTNIMGASKRFAEMVLQSLQAHGGPTTFSMVRFGNVLGSSGSVVPLFRRQIVAGGPITITHPEITRYFMTIPEAAQLVLQAGAMGAGGDVFLLDMGEPVRIVDLARNMIELSGLRLRDDAQPDGDIAIHYVGLRPGEKLYEELLIGASSESTSHPRIMRANEAFVPWPALLDALDRLRLHIAAGDADAVRTLLAETVHEFQPTSHLVDHVASAEDERDDMSPTIQDLAPTVIGWPKRHGALPSSSAVSSL